MHSKKNASLYIDENVVRIIAAQVALVTIVLLIKQWSWLAVLLSTDFFLRAFTTLPSLLSINSKMIVRWANFRSAAIYAPPKKFAASLGFVLALAIAVLLYFNANTIAYSVTAILLLCTVLESVFNICLGCYIFNYIVLPVKKQLDLFNREKK
ncbi:DUF4395 domain-containing protein [Niabella aquatica]